MDKECIFRFDMQKLPNVLLADAVAIDAPNQHFRRKPTEFILYFITSGEMLLKEGSCEYKLKKGDVILLDPTRWHTGSKLACAVSYYYIHFQMDDIQEEYLTKEEYKKEYLQGKYSLGSQEAKESFLWMPKYYHITRTAFAKIILLFEEIRLTMKKQDRYYTIQAGSRLLFCGSNYIIF